MENNLNQQKLLMLKKILSEYLGVEDEDINNDDSLRDDLHMSPSDLTDFAQILAENGFEINPTQLATIETFEELADTLIQEEI